MEVSYAHACILDFKTEGGAQDRLGSQMTPQSTGSWQKAQAVGLGWGGAVGRWIGSSAAT